MKNFKEIEFEELQSIDAGIGVTDVITIVLAFYPVVCNSLNQLGKEHGRMLRQMMENSEVV